MTQQHARARVAHDSFHPLPHLRPVTVHQTIGARGFLLLEGASIQAHLRILKQFGTFRAEPIPTFMAALTVHPQHGLDGPFLSPQPGMLRSHATTRSSSSRTPLMAYFEGWKGEWINGHELFAKENKQLLMDEKKTISKCTKNRTR